MNCAHCQREIKGSIGVPGIYFCNIWCCMYWNEKRKGYGVESGVKRPEFGR